MYKTQIGLRESSKEELIEYVIELMTENKNYRRTLKEIRECSGNALVFAKFR